LIWLRWCICRIALRGSVWLIIILLYLKHNIWMTYYLFKVFVSLAQLAETMHNICNPDHHKKLLPIWNGNVAKLWAVRSFWDGLNWCWDLRIIFEETKFLQHKVGSILINVGYIVLSNQCWTYSREDLAHGQIGMSA
jgi:hypothetical protein